MTQSKTFDILCFLALVRTPTGKFHTPIIDDNQDGTVSIKYQPSEIGLHELDVFYQGQPIAGSPFKFHVDQVQTGYVTAYGPGLSHGVCNEPCHFRIVTKDAGSGTRRHHGKVWIFFLDKFDSRWPIRGCGRQFESRNSM